VSWPKMTGFRATSSSHAGTSRALALLTLVLLIAGTLVGCGRSNSEIVLGFSQSGRATAWREANSQSIRSAAEAAGIKLRFADAQDSQDTQIKALQAFIAERVDVIAFSPVVESGWDEVLREAKKSGIPVVIVERPVKVSDRLLYTTHLGPDFAEEGRNAARWLLDYKLGGIASTNVVELRGPDSAAATAGRTSGFREVLDTDSTFRLIASESGEFTRASGRAMMARLLKVEGRRINVLFAHNDELALGAIRAIEDARLKPGKDVIVISIDGTKAAFEAMLAGKLNVAVECNPLYGPQIMGVARDVVARRRLPHRLFVEEFTYPMEMAAEIFPSRKY
jgi:galactofuranose transport system substrate-binding protein